MEKGNRPLAFIAYLLPVIGPAIVLIAARKDHFALFHACHSLALTLGLALTPVVWGAVSWLALWIPLAGGLIAASLFALVIAAVLAVALSWLMGLLHALRGAWHGVWLFGGWGDSLYQRLAG